jgi:DNA phosphorothioation-associated putative methyltransferase
LLERLVSRYDEINLSHNVIKFRRDELKVSFLAYADYFDSAHPTLNHSITIDLVTGRSRSIDFGRNPNPPILHRKESLLPSDHPRRAEFESLTRAEEAAGLYQKTDTIGFKLNWERLVLSKGFSIQGHSVIRNRQLPEHRPAAAPRVERHKTALTRYDLSKPVKSLLEYGMLTPSTSFFDYGCGQGSDLVGLRSLGYDAEGWDPVFRPETPKLEADVVNLGYVLNVIEDPAERLEALCNAYSLTRKVLVVSTLVQQTGETCRAKSFGDGVITRRNTFQKYFEQQELHQYLEDALEATAVPVALGVFCVFRDPVEQQDFLLARTRRTIDWGQISARLGLGRPTPRTPRDWVDLYEKHRDLLDTFWATMLQLGRLPLPEEFPRSDELHENFGSPQKAHRLFLEKGGNEPWTNACETRRNDLLVYLALSNFRKPVPYRHLSRSLQQDIRTQFGDYTRALRMSRDLLFAVGDPSKIEAACESLSNGWQDPQALYIHSSLLEKLPPLLRVYVGCTSVLYGDINQADVIKVHKASGKVTFLVYDDFLGKPLPQLQLRIKISLRTRSMEIFDHSPSGQMLFFKERFLAVDHPARRRMEKFSAKLRKLGLREGDFGPTKSGLFALLESLGLNENLNKKRTHQTRN